MLQYSFIGSDSIKNTELMNAVEEFVTKFSAHISIAPNLLLLYTLDKEKKFIASLVENQKALSIEEFMLASIDKGYLASTWLKKL